MARLSRLPGGLLELELQDLEIELMAAIPRQLRDVLLDPDRAPKVIDRLFPPTHRNPAEEEEHRRLLGSSLLHQRLEVLERFEQRLREGEDAEDGTRLRLSAGDVDLFLQVVNDMRLLLGVELNVCDNDWFERGPQTSAQEVQFQFLAFLSALQESLLQAMQDLER